MRHFQPTAGIVLRFTRGRCRAIPFALASLSCTIVNTYQPVRSLHSQDNHLLAKPPVYTSIGRRTQWFFWGGIDDLGHWAEANWEVQSTIRPTGKCGEAEGKL